MVQNMDQHTPTYNCHVLFNQWNRDPPSNVKDVPRASTTNNGYR